MKGIKIELKCREYNGIKEKCSAAYAFKLFLNVLGFWTTNAVFLFASCQQTKHQEITCGQQVVQKERKKNRGDPNINNTQE